MVEGKCKGGDEGEEGERQATHTQQHNQHQLQVTFVNRGDPTYSVSINFRLHP